jgi:hypothetical protein
MTEAKKIGIQASVAALIYILISLVLERDLTSDILVRELRDGLIFGLAYGLILWIWKRFKGRKDS